jgi:hypothetical protein
MTNEKLFANDQTVRGMKLLDLLDWAWQSDKNEPEQPPRFGALALPPVQRTLVWGPKQIVDLWDSALRGLPLGSLYMVQRPKEGEAVRPVSYEGPIQIRGCGWDLLDGQQRLRALLLGRRGPGIGKSGPDARCLWVDLAATANGHCLSLHLTSSSQPFGYHPTDGSKLSVSERRSARDRIDSKANPITIDGRSAYNHELFSKFLSGELRPAQTLPGWRENWPPLPAKAMQSGAVFPLHFLLHVWNRQEGRDWIDHLLEGSLEAIQNQDIRNNINENVVELCRAVKRFDSLEIALIKAEVNEHDLVRLFDRIGHGGTRLEDDERRYSIYKHHWPYVHNAIGEILSNESVGRVLPPAKIADSVILIANALSHAEPNDGNYLPGVETFAKEIASETLVDRRRRSSLRDQLKHLLPRPDEDKTQPKNGPLAAAFQKVFVALRYSGPGDFGLPRIMLTKLSPQLVQVLLLWAINDAALSIYNDRKNLIRFVLFWRLCVTNEDKARPLCFEKIRSAGTTISFISLYRALIGSNEDIAIRLLSPERMRLILSSDSGADWRLNAARFVARNGLDEEERQEDQASKELARRWWMERGATMLLWLQRTYVERAFAAFNPAFGTDDETPYDVDHMIPQSAWGSHWTNEHLRELTGRLPLDNPRVEQIRGSRKEIGDSLGNKWLVDFSINRGWNDASFSTKLDELEKLRTEDEKCARELLQGAFDPHGRQCWLDASGHDGRNWSEERRSAFQASTENRSSWLYERFYEDLGFSEWLIADSNGESGSR